MSVLAKIVFIGGPVALVATFLELGHIYRKGRRRG